MGINDLLKSQLINEAKKTCENAGFNLAAGPDETVICIWNAGSKKLEFPENSVGLLGNSIAKK